jgi:hypothetical protein
MRSNLKPHPSDYENEDEDEDDLQQRNLFVRAASATLCPRCQTNPTPMLS